jgi:uroporphyrinogen-III synthase
VRRVLVLRARDDAGRTAARLRDIGFEAVLSPVLEPARLEISLPEGPFDAVLATSAKAVEYLPAPAGLRETPLHTVGARTARMAEKQGWRTYLAAGKAAALLALIKARYIKPARFLYLAGRDRKDDLETGLRAAGHEVVVVETYEARAATALSPEALAAFAGGELAAVLHYSRRSAEIFLALAREAGIIEPLRKIPQLALSADAAAPLERELGVKPLIAPAPDEGELLGLLLQRGTLKEA